MPTNAHPDTVIKASEHWANETTVMLQRFSFERAVRHLPKIEALALIRAAYDCPLEDAKLILRLIQLQ